MLDAQATDFLVGLGSVEEIRALAAEGLAPDGEVKFNTHIHLPPNFSAFETVSQAVDLAAEQGVGVLGVGNYYDFAVYQTFVQAVREKGIFPLFGTEVIALETDLQQQGVRINDPGNPGKYYICGKGISKFEQLSKRAEELLGTIRKNDQVRMSEIIGKIDQIFSSHGVEMKLDEQAVVSRVVKRHGCKAEMVTLQERHLCQAFQEVFFEAVTEEQRADKLTEVFGVVPKSDMDNAVVVQNEIRSNLMKAGKPCFAEETFVNLSQAKELILELGGIPCYPVIADGSSQRCEYETPLKTLIDNLKNNGYSMVEFIPLRNQPDVLSEYAKAIRRAGIVVVAGTEHNTLDLLPIEPACVNGQAIPKEVNEIFFEGVCVLAGHAFLKAQGQGGFVDEANNPNQNYSSDEERIADFCKIGVAVLARYFQSQSV